MQIQSLTVGIVSTNCYILSADENAAECVVIDPGDEAKRILRAVGSRRIAAILLTHGHFDHIGAVAGLKGEDTPVLIHELDAPMLEDPGLNGSRLLLRQDWKSVPATDLLQEGSRRTFAGLDIEVLHTPGHTPGSVCYRIGDQLFTGDTLFEHGWGRTDLPGGDEHALFASLRRLMPLARTLTIHPGHNS